MRSENAPIMMRCFGLVKAATGRWPHPAEAKMPNGGNHLVVTAAANDDADDEENKKTGQRTGSERLPLP